MSTSFDFNLHDFVGIRLLDAGPTEIDLVRRQVGPIEGAIQGEPDIVVRFVDQLQVPLPLTSIGLDAGFDSDSFYVLRGKNKSRARVRMALDQVGKRCEIVCERGIAAVPHLIAIVNLTALAKGILPLHASAFEYGGTGVLATGWAKGGKTETLLSFMARGATYVGDEWVYFGADGRIFGIPEPIRLWDWHLDNLPALRSTLSRKARLKLRLLRFIAGAAGRMARTPGETPGPLSSMARRVSALVERQRYAHFPPQRAFGATSCKLEGVVDVLFFVLSHESQDVTVRSIDAATVADRMVFSLREERADLMSLYNEFRFAFPNRESETIESASARELELLERLIASRTCYELRHPYPVAFERLYEAVEPFTRKNPGSEQEGKRGSNAA